MEAMKRTNELWNCKNGQTATTKCTNLWFLFYMFIFISWDLQELWFWTVENDVQFMNISSPSEREKKEENCKELLSGSTIYNGNLFGKSVLSLQLHWIFIYSTFVDFSLFIRFNLEEDERSWCSYLIVAWINVVNAMRNRKKKIEWMI